MHLVFYFAWQKKLPNVQLYAISWAMANGLVEYLRVLNEYDWKPDDKEIWGRAM